MANGVGVVDSDYRGELKVPMINLGTEAYTIQPGERVAQLCIAPVYTAAFAQAAELGDTQRRGRLWLNGEVKRMKDLILASQSPRRKELLSLYTTDFTVCVSDFDEDAVTADTPARLVEQLARGKCLAVAKEHPGAVVLGCDTVVDVNGEVFGKPPQPGRCQTDAPCAVRRDPLCAHRCLRFGWHPHRELCGYLQGHLFPTERGGDRAVRRHRGALR